jgi:uncharacterized repeat protein (TIGR01451 family)
MRQWLLALLAVPLSATAAHGAALGITKTSAVVSDPLADLLPLRIPGAVVDYTVVIANPLANSTTTVSGVVYSDPIPARTALRVTDLASAGKGPVDFVQTLSGLSYTYSGLSSTTDTLDFSADGGTTWTYVPVADANGYDAAVTNIRVRLSGNQTAGTSVSLRFRVQVN